MIQERAVLALIEGLAHNSNDFTQRPPPAPVRPFTLLTNGTTRWSASGFIKHQSASIKLYFYF